MQKAVFVIVFALCCLIAILFAKQTGFLLVLVIGELLAIFIVVELLYRTVPFALFNASRDNCFRVDGTLSRRRKCLERKAALKVYNNLLAVTALLAMAGNLMALWIDASILPLPLASETVSLFSPDLHAWRDRIADANLENVYSNWRNSGPVGFEATIEPNFVKTTFPIILGIASFWLVCGTILILKMYRFSLSQFELGIRMRNKEYVDQDIGLFQSHEDYADAQPDGFGFEGISV